MEFVAVVAMTEDRIIATEDGVPWDYPEDVKQYKDRVSENPVIVGRTTYESMLPNPPGARQIVMSRSLESVDSPMAIVAKSVADAVAEAKNIGNKTTYIIGGGEIYNLLSDEFDRMVVTIVEDTIDPTAYDQIVCFPKWDQNRWTIYDTDDSYAGFRIEFWKRTDPT